MFITWLAGGRALLTYILSRLAPKWSITTGLLEKNLKISRYRFNMLGDVKWHFIMKCNHRWRCCIISLKHPWSRSNRGNGNDEEWRRQQNLKLIWIIIAFEECFCRLKLKVKIYKCGHFIPVSIRWQLTRSSVERDSKFFYSYIILIVLFILKID